MSCRSVAAKATEVDGHRLKHLLKHVGGILRPQSPTPAPGENKRTYGTTIRSQAAGSRATTVEEAAMSRHCGRLPLLALGSGSLAAHGHPVDAGDGTLAVVCHARTGMSMGNRTRNATAFKIEAVRATHQLPGTPTRSLRKTPRCAAQLSLPRRLDAIRDWRSR